MAGVFADLQLYSRNSDAWRRGGGCWWLGRLDPAERCSPDCFRAECAIIALKIPGGIIRWIKAGHAQELAGFSTGTVWRDINRSRVVILLEFPSSPSRNFIDVHKAGRCNRPRRSRVRVCSGVSGQGPDLFFGVKYHPTCVLLRRSVWKRPDRNFFWHFLENECRVQAVQYRQSVVYFLI